MIMRSSTLHVFLLASALAATTSDAFAPPKLERNAHSKASAASTTPLKAGPFDALSELGQTLGKEVGSLLDPKKDSEPKIDLPPKIPDVVVDPDYKLAVIFLVGGILLDLIPYIQLTFGPLVTLLGVLFVVQASRIRFCFDETAFELRTSGVDENGVLKKTGENIVVGNENR
jgi:hypothetical protein